MAKGQFIFLAGKANEDLRGLVKGLQNYGNALVIAVDGNDALRLLRKNKNPVLILFNSTLEGISTLELCKKIKQMKRFANIPVLILEDQPFERTEYEIVGVHEVVKKPYSSTEINERAKEQAASQKGGFSLNLSFQQQMIGVGVLFALFVSFMLYFILVPMFLTEKGKQTDDVSKKKAQKIVDSAREMDVRY